MTKPNAKIKQSYIDFQIKFLGSVKKHYVAGFYSSIKGEIFFAPTRRHGFRSSTQPVQTQNLFLKHYRCLDNRCHKAIKR